MQLLVWASLIHAMDFFLAKFLYIDFVEIAWWFEEKKWPIPQFLHMFLWGSVITWKQF